jgi:hypothetical protein
VQTVTERAVLDPAGNLWTSCHVVAGRWVLESNGGDTGGTYRWLLDLLYGGTDADAHARAEAAVAAVSDEGRHLVAHIGPAIFNLAEMNPFQPAGIMFPFPMLHLDRPTRGDFLRGFFENVAFAIRGNCEQIAAVTGRPTERLWVSGGMTQSPTLLGILAATLQVRSWSATSSASPAARCSPRSAAGSTDVARAVAAMVRTHEVLPAAARAVVDARYRRWRESATFRSWTLTDPRLRSTSTALRGYRAAQWEAYRRALARSASRSGWSISPARRRRGGARPPAPRTACRSTRPSSGGEDDQYHADRGRRRAASPARGRLERPGRTIARRRDEQRPCRGRGRARPPRHRRSDRGPDRPRDYVAAKPAPDAYRVAARALALEPAACVVIEDIARGAGGVAATACRAATG